MSVTNTLFINSSSQGGKVHLVKVHPLVLFNVTDHYARRELGLPRVIGALLGQYSDGVVNITNSFAVTHKEDANGLGVTDSTKMYQMHHFVNRSEILLGWYSTKISKEEAEGDPQREINLNSAVLQEVFTEKVKNESSTRPTINLVIDTTLENGKLEVKAFTSAPTPLGKFGAQCYAFKQIEVEIVASAPERFAIHTVAQSTVTNDGAEYKSLAPIASDIDFLKIALQKLLGLLTSTLDYVNKVVDGSIEADNNIGYQIAQALSSIPRIDADAYKKTFSNSEKDIRMVQNLISLVEEQLNVAAPLVVS